MQRVKESVKLFTTSPTKKSDKSKPLQMVHRTGRAMLRRTKQTSYSLREDTPRDKFFYFFTWHATCESLVCASDNTCKTPF